MLAEGSYRFEKKREGFRVWGFGKDAAICRDSCPYIPSSILADPQKLFQMKVMCPAWPYIHKPPSSSGSVLQLGPCILNPKCGYIVDHQPLQTHVSHSLKSLKGVIFRESLKGVFYRGTSIGVIEGDTRSLDYSSCERLAWSVFGWQVVCSGVLGWALANCVLAGGCYKFKRELGFLCRVICFRV